MIVNDEAGLRRILHGPGSLQAGTPGADRAIEGLLSYAAEAGAEYVVYHAANFPDRPASEDALLALLKPTCCQATTKLPAESIATLGKSWL